jgi:hypothetical protein
MYISNRTTLFFHIVYNFVGFVLFDFLYMVLFIIRILHCNFAKCMLTTHAPHQRLLQYPLRRGGGSNFIVYLCVKCLEEEVSRMLVGAYGDNRWALPELGFP